MKTRSQGGRVLQGFFRAEPFRGASTPETGAPVAQPMALGRSRLAPEPPRPDLLPVTMRGATVQPRSWPGVPGRPRLDLSPARPRAVQGRIGQLGSGPQPGPAWTGALRPELLPGTAPRVFTTPVPAGKLRIVGEGRPLEPGIRREMEKYFQVDLSGVRVHEGATAQAMGALAFTLGDSIHFAPGRFDPKSREGVALLGHELAHVVQQRVGRVINPYGQGIAIVQDPELEAEAERSGRELADRAWPRSKLEAAGTWRARRGPPTRPVAQAMEQQEARLVVKVGLDQWVTVYRNARIDLYTDGLSGCVAVVLLNTERAFLAHVYSRARDHWNDHKDKLEYTFKCFGTIKEVHLVANEFRGNAPEDPLVASLKSLISKLTSANIVKHRDNGVLVSPKHDGWNVLLKEVDQLSIPLFVPIWVRYKEEVEYESSQATSKKSTDMSDRVMIHLIGHGGLSEAAGAATPVDSSAFSQLEVIFKRWLGES